MTQLLKFTSFSDRHCPAAFSVILQGTTSRPGHWAGCRLIVAGRCYSLPRKQVTDSCGCIGGVNRHHAVTGIG
jgi:hypothetical protein